VITAGASQAAQALPSAPLPATSSDSPAGASSRDGFGRLSESRPTPS